MTDYDPKNWYWIVGGRAEPFSSSAGDYVSTDSATYMEWLTGGNRPSRIISEAELGEVLAEARVRPVAANVLDGFKDSHARRLTLEVVAKILLYLVNEVRTLKGQNTVTAAQFRAFVKDQM